MPFVRTRPVIDIPGADAVLAAAARGVAPVISVVDTGGALVHLHRPDEGAGGERRGDHRQGAHGGDLPAAEPRLRSAKRPMAGRRPSSRRRGAAAGPACRSSTRGRSSARSAWAAPRRPMRTRSWRRSGPVRWWH